MFVFRIDTAAHTFMLVGVRQNCPFKFLAVMFSFVSFCYQANLILIHVIWIILPILQGAMQWWCCRRSVAGALRSSNELTNGCIQGWIWLDCRSGLRSQNVAYELVSAFWIPMLTLFSFTAQVPFPACILWEVLIVTITSREWFCIWRPTLIEPRLTDKPWTAIRICHVDFSGL